MYILDISSKPRIGDYWKWVGKVDVLMAGDWSNFMPGITGDSSNRCVKFTGTEPGMETKWQPETCSMKYQGKF